MPSCFVPTCNHRAGKEICRFRRFPIHIGETLRLWENMCRRSDRRVTRDDRICSCHFSETDSTVPTVFSWNEVKPTRKTKRSSHSSTLPDPSDSATGTEPAPKPPQLELVPEPEPIPQPQLVPELSNPIPIEKETIESLKKENTELREKLEALTLAGPSRLAAENYFLAQEVEELKKEIEKGPRLTFEAIEKDEVLLCRYTGLPSSEHFKTLLRLIERFGPLNYYDKWNVLALSGSDQLFCTLIKLRLNLCFFDLANRFKVSTATIHNVVITYIYALHNILFTGMTRIPPREKNSINLPYAFFNFRNCRIVLDCTEIEIEIPSAMDKQKAVYSHYKARHTFKVLVGIAPNATITFVSNVYPGSSSDKSITKDCGVLHHLSAGDLIIADKGFLISDLCSERGIAVNIPPFLRSPQFTPDEVRRTTQIARARIHVERAINRLKNFRVLDYLASSMRPHASVVVQVCASLVNLQYSLLKENDTLLS